MLLLFTKSTILWEIHPRQFALPEPQQGHVSSPARQSILPKKTSLGSLRDHSPSCVCFTLRSVHSRIFPACLSVGRRCAPPKPALAQLFLLIATKGFSQGKQGRWRGEDTWVLSPFQCEKGAGARKRKLKVKMLVHSSKANPTATKEVNEHLTALDSAS